MYYFVNDGPIKTAHREGAGSRQMRGDPVEIWRRTTDRRSAGAGEGNSPEAEAEVFGHLKHERGHYEQSKRFGPAYLLGIAAPSIVSVNFGSEVHESMPWEKGADRLSDSYYDKIPPPSGDFEMPREKMILGSESQHE